MAAFRGLNSILLTKQGNANCKINITRQSTHTTTSLLRTVKLLRSFPARVRGVMRQKRCICFFKASRIFHQGERILMPKPVHFFTVIAACFKQLALCCRSILSGFVVFSFSKLRHSCGVQIINKFLAALMFNFTNFVHAHNKVGHNHSFAVGLATLRSASLCQRRYVAVRSRC